jgi:uncharacterized protein
LAGETAKAQLRVWALTGAHAGDNDQVIALAEALGLPFEVKQLEYNRLRSLGPRLLGRSVISLSKPSRERILSEPPPDLTISAGHRSVAAVQALRHRSRGRTRSIHVGFPRVSPGRFDLVIATTQYPMPDHPKLLRVPYALTTAATRKADHRDTAQLAAFAAPRQLLIVGGRSLYWTIDEPKLVATLNGMLSQAQKSGGSVLVTTSPRTPNELYRRLANILASSKVPSVLATPGEHPRLAGLLEAADSIRVTADSVAMLSDAMWSSKPIGLVPVAKTALGRFVMSATDRIQPGKPLHPQDLRMFWHGLREIGVGDTPRLPTVAADRLMHTILSRAWPIVDDLRTGFGP